MVFSQRVVGAYTELYDNYQTWLQAYRRSTAVFEDTLANMVTSGDVVWVHDYHMMLLPKALRARKVIQEMNYTILLHHSYSSLYSENPSLT